MAEEFYRGEIVIDVNDQDAENRVRRAEERIKSTFNRLERQGKALSKTQIAPIISARDKLTEKVMAADRIVKKLDAAHASPVIEVQDKVSNVLMRTNKMLDALDKRDVKTVADMKGPLFDEIIKAKKALEDLGDIKTGPVAELKGELFNQLSRARSALRIVDNYDAEPEATLRDRVSGKARQIRGDLRQLTSRTWQVTIQAKDRASRVLSGIRDRAASPLTLLGAGLGGYGLGSLTVGAAMAREQQMMAMEHWLDGNKALAKETVGWLQGFADRTPFEMTDLFPAMTRAIGVNDGDVNKSKKLLEIATDMAALTPGKTVQDAMEALADAQMGEFERMKEFQVKMTKGQYEAIGGWESFLGLVQKRVDGGAEKLSQTALGRVSTITDKMKGLFRETGEGILDALSPRLEKIVKWFDENKDVVADWKRNLTMYGRDAAEGILSTMEGALGYIKREYFDNPAFKELTISGKIGYIIGDLGDDAAQKAVEIGARIGVKFAEGVWDGVLQAAQKDAKMRLLIGFLVGMKTPGPVQVKVASGFGTIAALSLDVPESAKPGMIDDKTRRAINTVKMPSRYALGGILTNPHLGLVAEDGPEAIIPLSPKRRKRAIDLWEKTGRELGVISSSSRLLDRGQDLWEVVSRRLGVAPYAYGGFTAPLSPSIANERRQGSMVVNNFYMDGAVKQTFHHSENEEQIQKIINEAANMVAFKLKQIFQNTT